MASKSRWNGLINTLQKNKNQLYILYTDLRLSTLLIRKRALSSLTLVKATSIGSNPLTEKQRSVRTTIKIRHIIQGVWSHTALRFRYTQLVNVMSSDWQQVLNIRSKWLVFVSVSAPNSFARSSKNAILSKEGVLNCGHMCNIAYCVMQLYTFKVQTVKIIFQSKQYKTSKTLGTKISSIISYRSFFIDNCRL